MREGYVGEKSTIILHAFFYVLLKFFCEKYFTCLVAIMYNCFLQIAGR